MEFSAKKASPASLRSQCMVIGIFEKNRLSDAATAIDKASGGYIRTILKRGDLNGKAGQTLLLHDVPDIRAERVLLVGCGQAKGLDSTQFLSILGKTATTLRNLNCHEAAVTLTELDIKDQDMLWKARQTVQLVRDAFYRFDKFKKQDKPGLQRITLIASSQKEVRAMSDGISYGAAIASGMDLAKDLGNLPGNVCTPSYLAKTARDLGKGVAALKISVLEEADMKKLKMGALLSVARGSRQPAKLIVMQYKGGNRGEAPVVLVGKGITFDSGGISIKPSPAMDEMKYDMCGAAGVIGTMATIVELGLPVNVTVLVPTCENMPDGNASKPGDIVTSMSGQTIEVLNTDAEGRLILCDALTYAGRYKPDTVIDIATLTGACVIALGKHPTGLLGNDQALADDLLSAGTTSADHAWQMPLWEEYQDQLDSNFADMANIGGRDAGTITAACFLSRFTKTYRWAHLDIAGTAWHSGANKGATGRPVPLLTQYLLDRVGW